MTTSNPIGERITFLVDPAGRNHIAYWSASTLRYGIEPEPRSSFDSVVVADDSTRSFALALDGGDARVYFVDDSVEVVRGDVAVSHAALAEHDGTRYLAYAIEDSAIVRLAELDLSVEDASWVDMPLYAEPRMLVESITMQAGEGGLLVCVGLRPSFSSGSSIRCGLRGTDGLLELAPESAVELDESSPASAAFDSLGRAWAVAAPLTTDDAVGFASVSDTGLGSLVQVDDDLRACALALDSAGCLAWRASTTRRHPCASLKGPRRSR